MTAYTKDNLHQVIYHKTIRSFLLRLVCKLLILINFSTLAFILMQIFEKDFWFFEPD